MKEPLHDIDELFRDNIESLQEQPADNVWQNIEAGLDKNVAEKYKKSALFFKRLSLVLLLLLGTAGMYEVYTWNRKGSTHVNSAITKATGKNDNADNTEQASATGDNQSSHPKKLPGIVSNKADSVLPESNRYSTNEIAANNNQPKTKQENTVDHLSTNNKNIKQHLTVAEDIDKNNTVTTINDNKLLSTYANDKTVNLVLAAQPLQTWDSLGISDLLNIPNHPVITVNKVQKEITSASAKTKKTSPDNRRGKLSVTAFFSPEIAGYNLKDNDDIPVSQQNSTDDKNTIEQREKHKFSFVTGVNIAYRLTGKWKIETGLNFSKTTIDTGPATLYAKPDNDGKIQYCYNSSSGYAFISPPFSSAPNLGDSLLSTTSFSALEYLGVPVNVGYLIKAKKWLITPTAGIGINFLTRSYIETHLKNDGGEGNEVITKVQGLRPVYFNALASVDIQYPLFKNVSLSVMPTLRFALTSINKNNIVQSYTRSFGTSFGINYRF